MFSKEVKEVCQDVINRIKSKNFIPFNDNIMSESTCDLFCSAIEADTKNMQDIIDDKFIIELG